MTLSGSRSVASFMAAATLMITGCASLPDVASATHISANVPIDFSNASGPVSVAVAKNALRKLEDNDSDSTILLRHLAYEQAVNIDSPLVLGNRLTLLQNGPDTYRAMFNATRQYDELLSPALFAITETAGAEEHMVGGDLFLF